jgi:hypothetical protein
MHHCCSGSNNRAAALVARTALTQAQVQVQVIILVATNLRAQAESNPRVRHGVVAAPDASVLLGEYCAHTEHPQPGTAGVGPFAGDSMCHWKALDTLALSAAGRSVIQVAAHARCILVQSTMHKNLHFKHSATRLLRQLTP